MRIGSWPGVSFPDNAFVAEFCSGLAMQGAEMVDVADLSAEAPVALDALIVHWPEQVFWQAHGKLDSIRRAARALGAIRHLRARGTKVVWLVHNLHPHDSSLGRRLIWGIYAPALARSIDAFCTLSPATVDVVRQAFPFPKGLPAIGLHHPAYPNPVKLKSKATTRASEGLSDEVLRLAFVGAVSPYKGVAELSQAVARSENARIQLVIAGRCRNTHLNAELSSIASNSPRIIYREGRLSDSGFRDLVRSADYVALPFRDYLHSGSLVHALSLGRPVITPRTPYAEELQRLIGASWVLLYDNDIEAHLFALPDPPTGEPDLAPLSTSNIGHELHAFLKEVVSPLADKSPTSSFVGDYG